MDANCFLEAMREDSRLLLAHQLTFLRSVPLFQGDWETQSGPDPKSSASPPTASNERLQVPPACSSGTSPDASDALPLA
jgi:hypothetical protein